MPKQRGAQSRETTLSRLVKEVAVMQELQVGGGGWRGGGWGCDRARSGRASSLHAVSSVQCLGTALPASRPTKKAAARRRRKRDKKQTNTHIHNKQTNTHTTTTT